MVFEAWLDETNRIVSFHEIPDSRYYSAEEHDFWQMISVDRIPCAVKRRFFRKQLASFQACKLLFSVNAELLHSPLHLLIFLRFLRTFSYNPVVFLETAGFFNARPHRCYFCPLNTPPRKAPRLPASRLCPASDIDGRLQAFRPENLSRRGIIENIVYGRTSAAAGFRKAGCGRCPSLRRCRI